MERPISPSVGGHLPSLLRAWTRISAAVVAVAVAYPLSRGREAISRLTYAGAYVLAYGVVYATVVVARSLPGKPGHARVPRRRAGSPG